MRFPASWQVQEDTFHLVDNRPMKGHRYGGRRFVNKFQRRDRDQKGRDEGDVKKKPQQQKKNPWQWQGREQLKVCAAACRGCRARGRLSRRRSCLYPSMVYMCNGRMDGILTRTQSCCHTRCSEENKHIQSIGSVMLMGYLRLFGLQKAF